tara:strand:+ start:724 stop:873 length:150 start_codon:yes stop_codon:yes gene_type:complete
LIWLLKIIKLKIKYNDLAQLKPESYYLSPALLAIYYPLGTIKNLVKRNE